MRTEKEDHHRILRGSMAGPDRLDSELAIPPLPLVDMDHIRRFGLDTDAFIQCGMHTDHTVLFVIDLNRPLDVDPDASNATMTLEMAINIRGPSTDLL
jgi:hypothetical protein